MDKKIIIVIIIILIIIVSLGTAIFLTQDEETPPVNNITVNETSIAVNETIDEIPPTNISEEEAMRIAEEASREISPDTGGIAVSATLFRWTEEFHRDWVPEDIDRTWVWNVSMTYTRGPIQEGYLWVDAQTGEIIMN